MKIIIHRSAAILAVLSITTFFISTIFVELLGSNESIAMVKGLIVMPGLFILIPCIVITGGTGFALSKVRSSELISSKKKRMPLIAVNGIFILIPAAIFLNQSAYSGDFGSTFYIVQSVELIAGAMNLLLMGLNMRDGLNLSGKLHSND
jgi:hypothetical protein